MRSWSDGIFNVCINWWWKKKTKKTMMRNVQQSYLEKNTLLGQLATEIMSTGQTCTQICRGNEKNVGQWFRCFYARREMCVLFSNGYLFVLLLFFIVTLTNSRKRDNDWFKFACREYTTVDRTGGLEKSV